MNNKENTYYFSPTAANISEIREKFLNTLTSSKNILK